VDRTIQCQCDSGDVGIIGRTDRKRVDVEAATGEKAGDPSQYARSVFDEDREHMLSP
jgi:hypothetical protein